MIILIPILLFIISFIFRSYGFFANYPFWVDEFSTAVQSQFIIKYGLSIFNNADIYFEHHNIPTHFITAFLFQIFGTNEWIARLPSLIFGSLIPVIVFFLGRYFFNSKTGLSAALLTAFSYFQITWSRQARSYVLLQLIILITTFIYFKVLEEKSNKRINLILLFIFSFFGFITHSFFYILLFSLILHYLLVSKNHLTRILTNKLALLIFIILLIVSKQTGLIDTFIIYLKQGGFGTNNLWYYHSFFWREYVLLTFLAVIGLILTFLKKRRIFSFLAIYLIFHLVFITFGFKPLATRYVLPIFPFILILVGNSLNHIPNLFFKNQKHILTAFVSLLLTFFIIVNGDKFVNRPKEYYSVNHDFREIALVDYKKVYDLIKNKGDLNDKKTAIIETWTARIYWYINPDYQPTYIFKWKGNLPYIIDQNGEKFVPNNNNLKLIEDIADLKKVITKYPKGFIFIDDTSLPQDVVSYAQKYFKKELYLDHYPLDDNPYSIWPATLYSWGID